MDNFLDKEKIEDNRTSSSLAGSLVVHWHWNLQKTHRTFLHMRKGGDTETVYDLETKYGSTGLEGETVLIYFEQLIDLSPEEQVEEVVNLLTDKSWQWDPQQKVDFRHQAKSLLGV